MNKNNLPAQQRCRWSERGTDLQFDHLESNFTTLLMIVSLESLAAVMPQVLESSSQRTPSGAPSDSMW